MPLGLTGSGYSSGMDKSFDERLRDNKIRSQAAAQGKSVKDFLEDNAFLEESKALDAQDQRDMEEENWAGFEQDPAGAQPESMVARLAKEEGLRQANVLREGGAPEKMDTGTYTELDAATAAVDSETLDELATEKASARTAGIDDLSASGPNVFRQNYADSETLDELATEEASARTAGIDDLSASGSDMYKKKYTENFGPGGVLDSEAQEDLDIERASERSGLMPIEDAEAQIDEMAAAGEQSNFQRYEEDPAVKEFKELNEKAVAGDPKALKDRASIFKGMPKEEKAMAKEELGNYYIGPGGYAINLDKLGASRERAVNMSMLQFVPDHAKSQMLASWGYIDQEDVDKSPDDPKITVAEIKVAGTLAVQEMVNKGSKDVAVLNNSGAFKRIAEQTRSAEVIKTGQYKNNTDLSTMNNSMKEKLARLDIDWKELQQHSTEIMHLNDLDLDQWKTEKGFNLRKEEMKDVRDHFAKEMTFKYKNIENVHAFKGAQLAQRGAEFAMTYGLKSDAQQKAWVVKQHDMTMSKVQSLYDAGNPEGAVMVFQSLSPDTPFDITGYWKKLAKGSTFGNAAVEKEFEKMYGVGNTKTGINKYVSEKMRIRKKYSSDTPNEKLESTEIDNWVRLNQKNSNFTEPLGPAWGDMSEEERNETGGYPAWKAGMVNKAVTFEIGQGDFKGVYNAMESGKIKITPKKTSPVVEEPVVEKATVEGPETESAPPDIREVPDKPTMGNIQKQLNRINDTPKKMSGSLKKGEDKFNNILKAEGGIADKRLMMFNNREELLDYFEKRPELLSKPAGLRGDTIGRGASGSLVGTTKKNNLDLQHYVLKELEKRNLRNQRG
tara:strand:- start:573 stop:3089 length:2517 start_codon:yes stop_codon:yes gene_type:complete